MPVSSTSSLKTGIITPCGRRDRGVSARFIAAIPAAHVSLLDLLGPLTIRWRLSAVRASPYFWDDHTVMTLLSVERHLSRIVLWRCWFRPLVYTIHCSQLELSTRCGQPIHRLPCRRRQSLLEPPSHLLLLPGNLLAGRRGLSTLSCWAAATRAVHNAISKFSAAIGAPPADVSWIRVGDRVSDNFR